LAGRFKDPNASEQAAVDIGLSHDPRRQGDYLFIHPTLMAVVVATLFLFAAGVAGATKQRLNGDDTGMFMHPLAVALAVTALIVVVTPG
jgi:hypothetical protein